MILDRYEERQNRMIQIYQQVMKSDFAEELRKADMGLSMPDDPSNVLEYLGNIEPLKLSEEDKEAVVILTRKNINEKGAEYIWENRVFLRYELSYIIETFGLDWAFNIKT